MAFFDRWVRIEFHRRQATAQWKRLFHFVTSLPVCLVHKTMYLSATPWNQPLSGRELNSTRVFCLCQTAVVHRKSKGDLSTLKTTVMSGDLQCLAGVFWRGGGGKILWRKGHTLVLLAFFFLHCYWFYCLLTSNDYQIHEKLFGFFVFLLSLF